MPIAFVFSIQRLGVITKLFIPACFLNPSNSTGLKFGLYIVSQKPKSSMVLRFLIQFFTMSSVCAASLWRAISVSEIKSSFLFWYKIISTPWTCLLYTSDAADDLLCVD